MSGSESWIDSHLGGEKLAERLASPVLFKHYANSEKEPVDGYRINAVQVKTHSEYKILLTVVSVEWYINYIL